ncbi:CinA family protein [Vibrio mexicanus]|uniref:CinA family protein n=1 Tax=Vibrio mexicanus TaxID=1004326 RepID=UPI00063C9513|nr:nicotinamide-nucleotide amidohydrolase family protein [Vibrio mexicanus]
MKDQYSLSETVGRALQSRQLVLTTAESCTGGGISTAITDIAGSSDWFDRAFITYSNEAKMEMIDVQSKTLEGFGAVSEQTVTEMVAGALKYSNANVAIAVSGIAGPGGGSEEKPVGTVCFAWGDDAGWLQVETQYFNGDRIAVRNQVIEHALRVLYEHLCATS